MTKAPQNKTPKGTQVPAVTTPSKPCHENGTLIFERDGTQFFAGKYTGVSDRSYDLIIDLAKSVNSSIKGTNLDGHLKSFADEASAKILHIDWPDFGVIKWKRERFEKLLAAIKNDNIGTVYICCIGGHGRTGSMMTILAGISGAVPKGECPVQWLRDLYCENVVESAGQLDYIEEVTGLKVTSEPGKSAWVNQGAYGGQYGSGWQGQVYGGKKNDPFFKASSKKKRGGSTRQYAGSYLAPKGK